MANEYDTDTLYDIQARFDSLEQRVGKLERILASDTLRYLDEQLKLRGL